MSVTKNWHWQIIRFASYVFVPIYMFWYSSDPTHFENSIIESNLKWMSPVDYKEVDLVERIQKKKREEKLAQLKEQYEQRQKVATP